MKSRILSRSRAFSLVSILFCLSFTAFAAESIKPFVLADSFANKQVADASADAIAGLQAANFEILGQYAPYDGANIIVFTSAKLRELATRSERGGYGAALRVSVTRNDDKVEVAYTNPVYWANAYRMEADVDSINAALQSALGAGEPFGTGDKKLSAKDMRKYHYTFLMEYFDDPSELNNFDSHEQAVTTVRANLAKNVSSSTQVFELKLGSDTGNKQMTLFGVGLKGADAEDCGSDPYIMGRIDKFTPRHTAHLPYEILVYGEQVEALYGRFRIAISWPHLPMMKSDSGATFFKIMCAPGAIEKALIAVAGGSTEKKRAGGDK